MAGVSSGLQQAVVKPQPYISRQEKSELGGGTGEEKMSGKVATASLES